MGCSLPVWDGKSFRPQLLGPNVAPVNFGFIDWQSWPWLAKVWKDRLERLLVGGLEHEWIIFPIILGMSSSQMTNSIIFQRGWYTNQSCFLWSVNCKYRHAEVGRAGHSRWSSLILLVDVGCIWMVDEIGSFGSALVSLRSFVYQHFLKLLTLCSLQYNPPNIKDTHPIVPTMWVLPLLNQG